MQGREGVLAVGPAGSLGSICGQCFVLDPLTAGRAVIGYTALITKTKAKTKTKIKNFNPLGSAGGCAPGLPGSLIK